MSDNYGWIPKHYNISKLQNEFRTAGLPISFVGWSNQQTLFYIWTVYPTESQLQLAANIELNHNPAIDTEESKRILSEQMGYSIEKRLYNAEEGLKDVSIKVGK